jgi:hypothetical protein
MSVRFNKRGFQSVSGGLIYESKCGKWHLFRESAKTRSGKPLRRWWYITHRGQFAWMPICGPKGETRYRTRQAAEVAVNRLNDLLHPKRRRRRPPMAQDSQQELFNSITE